MGFALDLVVRLDRDRFFSAATGRGSVNLATGRFLFAGRFLSAGCSESVQRVLRLDAVRGALVDLPAQSSQRGHRGALTGRQAAGPQLAAGPGATLL